MAEMASWTPLKAYETAVTCCIQATQEFASTRHVYYTSCSAGVITHAPWSYSLEDLWRRKVNDYESILTKASSLLTVEAARTHNRSPRIGTIFTNDEPPSYEQATSAPNDTASGFASDVRVLKHRERQLRCWWRTLTESSPAMMVQCGSVMQDDYYRMDRMPSRTIVDMDEEMKQASAYLQDVEHGAREFLQQIDQMRLRPTGDYEGSETSSDRETIYDQETRMTAPNGTNRSIASQEQSQRKEDWSTKTAILETFRNGIYTWILRPLSWARRHARHQGPQNRTTTTTDSTRTNRQHGEAEPCEDTPLEFRSFQVQALYSYERAYEIGFRKGDLLSFTEGQVIDVVEVVDQNWLVGEFTDRLRKMHLGIFPREWTTPWHAEIHGRREVSAANSHHEALQRLISLSDWLHDEHHHYDLSEGHGLRSHRFPHYDIYALVERLDVLKVVLHETYRPHQRLEAQVEEMTERMESLRAKAVERMVEYQAFVDAYMFR